MIFIKSLEGGFTLKIALVLTDHFEDIKDLVAQLGQKGWIIIVNEDTYQSYYASENLEPKDRITGLTHPYAYTSYDLNLGDPLALTHWKFIDGLSARPCDLSPTIDLFYCEPDFTSRGVPIGLILMAAVDRERVFTMTNRLELENYIQHSQT